MASSTLCRRRGPQGIYKIRALPQGASFSSLVNCGRDFLHANPRPPHPPHLVPHVGVLAPL